MADYVTWVTHDYYLSIGQRRGVLSRDQIDEWHDLSFERTSGRQIYGGDLPFTNFFICKYGCDTYNP